MDYQADTSFHVQLALMKPKRGQEKLVAGLLVAGLMDQAARVFRRPGCL